MRTNLGKYSKETIYSQKWKETREANKCECDQVVGDIYTYPYFPYLVNLVEYFQNFIKNPNIWKTSICVSFSLNK